MWKISVCDIMFMYADNEDTNLSMWNYTAFDIFEKLKYWRSSKLVRGVYRWDMFTWSPVKRFDFKLSSTSVMALLIAGWIFVIRLYERSSTLNFESPSKAPAK